jgi:hypothetical protein
MGCQWTDEIYLVPTTLALDPAFEVVNFAYSMPDKP